MVNIVPNHQLKISACLEGSHAVSRADRLSGHVPVLRTLVGLHVIQEEMRPSVALI